ncbi:MAG: bifunctional UDP-N-acetylglucosamine diphosphorylase/glucosamine-1-phosphate N-acetyltransferase GlmU [Firmicutes bacterium]|nr:bifunctional UDP-N-acetylglucosamine diphosphorylase/glucosamine-1-phosphate N-acetyltransferase GlmU [Bacillota bacterium]
MKKTAVVILAAGKGQRMRSQLPKVLHQLNGRPMLGYVAAAAEAAGVSQTLVVVGHGCEQVEAAFPQFNFALQQPQLGTGHALQCAMPQVAADCENVLVVCGDTPLLTAETLSALMHSFEQTGSTATVLSARVPNPYGYGRIVRNLNGEVRAIVEERDASEEEKRICEINTGAYCFEAASLREALQQLTTDNAQGEYYLTDVIGILAALGKTVTSYLCADAAETAGVNDRVQLANAAAELRRRKNRALMLSGVTIIDPDDTYIEDTVTVGQDTIIEPQTYLRGNTVIGANCHIGPFAEIENSSLADGCRAQRCLIIESEAAENCNIGPFAYLRPGTRLARKVKAGHFVEIKKSEVGEGSKVPHLSYIGDTTIGRDVNIGCGTITCNYDGKKKHRTVIADRAFIGSNTNLVAPVSVGEGALVAAGSTITEDVPDGALGVARGRQRNVLGYIARKAEEAAKKAAENAENKVENKQE